MMRVLENIVAIIVVAAIIFGCLNKIIYLCIRYCKRGSKVFADMAQLVEQRIRNAWVPGSSPGIGSISGVSISGISTSVVHGLPKPGRRVRFPYSAQICRDVM